MEQRSIHPTKEVFDAIYIVYGNRLIASGYPKFAYEKQLMVAGVVMVNTYC